MNKEILKFCIEKGFLVDNDFLNLFNETSDIESIKLIIEKVKTYTKKNVLTKNLFEENKDEVHKIFSELPEKNQKNLEHLKIKLGLSIEISKESTIPQKDTPSKSNSNNIKILSNSIKNKKKIEVSDFSNFFRERFNQIKEILQENPQLDNLISIDKISGHKQNISIIGMVYEKTTTKNKNLLLEVEDLTGKIKLLVNNSKKELYKLAEEICLDSVLGFKCSGNNEMLFVNEIIFPEAFLPEKKKSPIEEYALFLGDLHFGSKLFLEKSFSKFIQYLKGEIPGSDINEIKKIKYIFIVGDLVAGIGVYPNQEFELSIPSLEDQYLLLAKSLNEIPKNIQIIISPGNHDCVRVMEPQPIFDKKYAWPLYELENVIITENPCLINFASRENFSGFNILTYHGFSYPYYANNVPELILKKAMNCPEEIMKYLLKCRHLAPTYSSTQFYPAEFDFLTIKKVPDFFLSGHTHKCGVSYYNNILIISTSCWEAKTSYQEKFGNEPDHCKVPMVNLKTRAIKILDFEEKEFEDKK